MSLVEKGESEERGKELIFWVCPLKNNFGQSSCNGDALSIFFFFFQYLIYDLYFIFNGFYKWLGMTISTRPAGIWHGPIKNKVGFGFLKKTQTGPGWVLVFMKTQPKPGYIYI